MVMHTQDLKIKIFLTNFDNREDFKGVRVIKWTLKIFLMMFLEWDKDKTQEENKVNLIDKIS